MESRVMVGDCLELLRSMDTDSIDLVITSPPYEDARTYGINFNLSGQAWVDWAFERYLECVRVCRGLVAWVVEGKTRQFRYSATPLLLATDLHRAGVKLRKPIVFHRVGIPGSGGPDWLRNDWEPVICSSKGKLPWSDNTACGHPPKWAPGGEMSHRIGDGTRRNQPRPTSRPKKTWEEKEALGAKPHTKNDGDKMRDQLYLPPSKANPGNVVHCTVGGGTMGSKLCHENEAPFPEKLVEVFVRSFCPPGGIVLDPFCGSGTTLAVADRFGRKAIGIDVRESQIELSKRRISAGQERKQCETTR